MLSQRNRAAAPTTAPNNNQLYESYSVSVNTSTKKIRVLIAILLIGLQAETLTVRQCKHGWQLFEVPLVQYLMIKGKMQ